MGYLINTILIIFNLSDTLGRFLPNYIVISLKVLKNFTYLRGIMFIILGILAATTKYNYIGVSFLNNLSLIYILKA